ncbi:CYTH domain-containing protein [Mediterraneibacter glycyrrhizinilyticus]|uniref:CYTH domain-containing protein n=1 Tax=Mediterraneibacter glycyrrhizinilyticus TaxID=342942 RepID=UPI0019612377|nr:CYTH domain-containing protein [Mediterraneibacter glycyrrhizinilyticus]MBM6750773.1 CYTH domain-containing protein [Mediterraneibacter glycyrrhizinilyticus]
MEIERKFLITSPEQFPFDPKEFSSRQIEQGYLCISPVVRIRRDNDDYFLTYKSKGLMVREEYNLPLTAEAYAHLRAKADGRIITKTRYVIPLENGLTLELDIFHGDLAPLILAEIEFPDEQSARAYQPPKWLGEDVTFSTEYHNSTLSKI